MARVHNFSAGPSTLPVPVLEQIRDEIVEFRGMGMSLIEASHRSKEYDAVHCETIALIKELLSVPDKYSILLLGGGATLQFGMVPMNFLREDAGCDFINSGAWAVKALKDAKKVGPVTVIWDGESSRYTTLPTPDSLPISSKSSYLHMTSNETIGGIQWHDWPDGKKLPICIDMSSDIMSRAIPVENFALIYAGAQKNLGPAGVTVVIIRDDMLDRCPSNLPEYLSYKTHATGNSLYNTPPVFSIYAMNLVLHWIKKNGGIEAIERANEDKAQVLYDAIDSSDVYYRCPVDPAVRSRMNVVFRLPTEELEAKFLTEATAAGLNGLPGHRSVGGCRASLYNAMPISGVRALAAFMAEFAQKNPA